jgi:flavorubredoxin
MAVTNTQSGTNVHEIAAGIYRISTPVVMEGGPGGFTFNQYLIAGDEPLIFHTGPRAMFPLVREAVASVMPVEKLRHVAFSHVESDECGSLNEWLSAAPHASPLCGAVAALVSVNDLADRPPRALADGEALPLGTHAVRWFDAPHLPHGWECGYLMEESTGTLLCGDLFTQLGNGPALTDSDVVGPAAAAEDLFRYSALNPGMGTTIRSLAKLSPRTLALMHGPSFSGDGAAALHALADEYDRRITQ